MRSLLLSAALALNGCPNTLLPDIRIRAETEAYLNQPVIEVLDRHEAGFNRTRYEVSTPHGRYACLIYGGHALDLGVISAMTCATDDKASLVRRSLMSDGGRRSFTDRTADTYEVYRPPSPPVSEYLFKDLPSSASARDVVQRVAKAADTADFARWNLDYSPKDQKLLDDQARRSLDAAWANPVAAAALRSAGIVETTSKAEYAAARYNNVAHRLDDAADAAAKLSAPSVARNVPGNLGGQGRDQAAAIADSRSFGEEYRERLVALGRAQERASMAREDVQETRREAEESPPAETARRGRGR